MVLLILGILEMSNIVSLPKRLLLRKTNTSHMKIANNSFKPATCSKYVIEGNTIAYTKRGHPYFKGLFAQAGININNIICVSDHTAALEKCKYFELEYASQYGKSEGADIESRLFSAITNCDYEEADRLHIMVDRRNTFKVV